MEHSFKHKYNFIFVGSKKYTQVNYDSFFLFYIKLKNDVMKGCLIMKIDGLSVRIRIYKI